MFELDTLIQAWRDAELGRFQRDLVIAFATGAFLYVLVWVGESVSHSRTDNYKSRSFGQDVVCWFYYRSGLNTFLLFALIPPSGHPTMPEWFNPLAACPLAAQVLLYLLVGEFFYYWLHRAMHRFGFLWAFHTTHHATERLTFASAGRFHPVEMIIQAWLGYLVITIFGGNPLTWIPLIITLEILIDLQHTQIPWKLGPLYKVFVTPSFHAYHHSTDQQHYDRNFSGGLFSFWDYLFGTAVQDTRLRPTQFGLKDIRTPTLWSMVTTPFVLLSRRGAFPERKDTKIG